MNNATTADLLFRLAILRVAQLHIGAMPGSGPAFVTVNEAIDSNEELLRIANPEAVKKLHALFKPPET